MGLFGIVRRIGTRAASSLGDDAVRAGAVGAGAGVAGGMLVDDIPLVGQAVDPTEPDAGEGDGGEGPLGSINPTLVLIAVIVLGFAYVMGGN